ncbi:MAG: class A beta-lactamase-related serine hydrolase [Intestinibacter sp.]|uniref:serine hydrolase n=1 Tax=Intestinibacter sp. TaxID=1965304 RepID=UPI0025C2D109|nr:serine hydrolase [Intestinibacter sp.]MCI6736747.1 class A beta-lactamase-related serine hydrolase [Intestinibacter sp.]
MERLSKINGKVGFYYKNLVTGEVISYNEKEPMLAASLIKLTVLGEVFREIENGEISEQEVFTTRDEEKVPSCGALNYMDEGLNVTLKDLYTLMIILSDNYATNILIDRCKIENINDFIKENGLKNTVLKRKMFDSVGASKGLENYTSAEDMALLLEKIYNGTLVSKEASAKMLEVLKNQRLNGKISFFLSSGENKVQIAHKTGEDTNITHDVGIVLGEEPFIICFLGNEVNVPEFERVMQDLSLEIYKKNK